MDKYRITEIFYSIQGEGCLTGTPAVFVRFAGCNRACKFCDTDYKQKFIQKEEDLILEIIARTPDAYKLDNDDRPILSPHHSYDRPWVVLTGGEPLMQLKPELISRLLFSGYDVNIQTNGDLFDEIDEQIVTITHLCGRVFWSISPKEINDAYLEKLWRYFFNRGVKGDNVEFKFLVTHSGWKPSKHIQEFYGQFYLQPVDNRPANVQRAIEIIRSDPKWKLSVQIHKLINIK